MHITLYIDVNISLSSKYLTHKTNIIQKPRDERNEEGLSKIKNMMMKKKLC